ncbi:Inner membrane protein YeeA [Pseudodesulfovibrio hydrargyri]|uniref:Inner membrane protein YeeA n=1 Tax=Pseudodesulfovibrio hydrargyri TaxID=2125990 RepID=A0A1J5MZR7_9BACT|nr:FUSC family protein [Pseudodesulfovibrio hydrargyri]OIQ51490.1 Inner membrane protein YeeA [Pseudodesulfovibrio hydrargyri]
MAFNVEKYLSSHVRHGMKVGLASVLAYVGAELIGLPYGYWAVITTVIVMQMHVADSIQMCLYRFTGTAIGAGMGILMILVFPPTHLYTLIAVFVGTGVCAYLTRYDARYRMAAITMAIVFLSSLQAENRIEYSLFRVAEIGVGVLCAFVVSVAVWPNRTTSVLLDRLCGQYDQVADDVLLLMDNFLHRQRKTDPDLFFDLAREVQANRDLYNKIYSTERRVFRDDMAKLSLQVNTLNSVVERLQSTPSLLNEVEGDGFDIIMTPELNLLARHLAVALRSIGRGVQYDPHPLARAVDRVEQRFIELREQGVIERFEVRRYFQVMSFINTVQHLGEFLLVVLNKPRGTV